MTIDATYPLVRPALARIAAIAFVLLAPFVAHAIWDYVEERRLDSRVRAVVASGAPTSTPHPVDLSPDAARADEYYRAAAALITSVRLGESHWEAHTDALEFVDRATGLPFAGFAPGSSYSYLVSHLITLSRLCERRAVDRARQGDANGAFDSLVSAAELSRTHPWAVYPQIDPVKSVARAPVGSDVRQRAERAFAALDRPESVARNMDLDRALMLERLGAESHQRQTIEGWLLRPWKNHLSVRRLDEYATLIRGGTPTRRDRTTDALIAMRDFFQRRATVLHCEHQLIAGAVTDCPQEMGRR